MPMHDWTRVPAGIYHAFHHRWIAALADSLNVDLLPEEYYALAEQQAVGFGPDVLALQVPRAEPTEDDSNSSPVGLLTKPDTTYFAETDLEFYRRKKSSIAIRHVSGDRLVALIEVVSPGNKNSRQAFQAFLDKACEFLERRVNLLIADPFPPTRRDPQGVHSAIWNLISDDTFALPKGKRLTIVSYACDLTTKAYIEPIAVGDVLPSMPLFLEPNLHVLIPLENTYSIAFNVMPKRWRKELTPATNGRKGKK